MGDVNLKADLKADVNLKLVCRSRGLHCITKILTPLMSDVRNGSTDTIDA